MKPAKKLYQILPIVLAALAVALPVMALENNNPQPGLDMQTVGPSSTVDLDPGNYCLSCHTPGDSRLAQANIWRGGIEKLANSPCPGLVAVQEQRFYTDRLMLSIERLQGQLDVEDLPESLTRRWEADLEGYAQLIAQPVTSLDAFVTQASILRYQLAKVYSQLNEIEEGLKGRNVLVGGAAASIVLLVSLAIGLVQTRRFGRGAAPRGLPSWKLLLGVGLVFVFFGLPIFRIFPAPTSSTTPEEQARQSILDTSSRAAGMTDRALARAWEFSRLAVAWWPMDTGQGQAALGQSLQAADEAAGLAEALWGEALAAQEAAAPIEVDRDNAALIVEAVASVQSRAWALRLIAQEWTAIDPQRAAQILTEAEALTNQGIGLYADLDLRGIAVAWAPIDLNRAQQAAGAISDPALQSWAYREIGLAVSQPKYYSMAADAADEVANPIHRARLLREIGVASGDEAFFDQALEALSESAGITRAYALADLAVASGRSGLADMIEADYPDARALAYAYGGAQQEAWEASESIENPYDRAHAQATIAVLFLDASQAGQIEVDILRQAALAQIAVQTDNAQWVDELDSAYYRVRVLTALGDLEGAWEAAQSLYETTPLVDLAAAMAESDPDLALEIVDQIDTEAGKFQALRQIALILPSTVPLERLLNLAEAARVSGAPLASAEAALQLAATLDQSDSGKARQALSLAQSIVEGISIKYK